MWDPQSTSHLRRGAKSDTIGHQSQSLRSAMAPFHRQKGVLHFELVPIDFAKYFYDTTSTNIAWSSSHKFELGAERKFHSLVLVLWAVIWKNLEHLSDEWGNCPGRRLNFALASTISTFVMLSRFATSTSDDYSICALTNDAAAHWQVASTPMD